MLRYAYIAATCVSLAMPVAAQAQGLVGGAREGAAAGDRALGPIGGVIGGAVGAGVGTVNGALGISPRAYYYNGRAHRCIYRHGRRYCRY